MTKTKPKKETKSTRIPPRVLYGSGMTTMMGNLASSVVTRDIYKDQTSVPRRRVLGYPLPPWQRGLEWDDEQCERFIQSVYTGVYLGLFVYNDSLTTNPEIDGVLIDGQQRLYAIERYVNGNLAVEGPDGAKYRWTDLTDEEQAHFNRMPMGFQIVQVSDETELKRLYNILNFGGTAHRPEQRAT